MSDGGKGSRPRPYSVTNEEYSKRWDAIFGRDVATTKKREEFAGDGTPIIEQEDGQSEKVAD